MASQDRGLKVPGAASSRDEVTVSELDHLVYAVPDLAAAVAHFAAETRVEPQPGGRHVGRGTANYLVGLGGRSYLEIIGPDADADAAEPERPRPFGLDELAQPKLVTWAVATDDLDATLARARAAGYDPGDGQEMSRRTPGGELLEWRLTPDRVARRRDRLGDGRDPSGDGRGESGQGGDGLGGVVPFVIDWGGCGHPTDRLTAQLSLGGLELCTSDPDAVRDALCALRVPEPFPTAITPASTPALRATLVIAATPGQPARYLRVD